jgi:hypothetical protein
MEKTMKKQSIPVEAFLFQQKLSGRQVIKNILMMVGLRRRTTLPFNFMLLLTAIFVAIPLISFSQIDPLAGHYSLRDRHQFITINFRPQQSTKAQIHDFNYFPGVGDSIINGPIFNFPDSLRLFDVPCASGSDHDIVTANLYGDYIDEVIAAWFTTDSSIVVAVSSVQPATHLWTIRSWWKIPRSELFFSWSAIQHALHLRLEKGEFDGDGYEEFILAYISADSTLCINLYDTDNGINFTSKAEISEQKIFLDVETEGDDLSSEWAWVERFNLAVKDLDQDGTSEIVLAGIEPETETTGKGFIKVYDFNPVSSTLVPLGKSTYFPGTNLYHRRIKIAVGEFDTTEGTECVIGWQGSIPIPKLIPARISADLLTISIGQTALELPGLQYEDNFILASGDLNYDDIEEIILCEKDSLQLYRTAGDLNLIKVFSVPVETGFGESYPRFWFGRQRGIVLADVNSDSSSNWGPEILVCQREQNKYSTYLYGFSIYEPVLDSNLTITGFTRTGLEHFPEPEFFFGLVAGTFDNVGSVRLGVPTLYSKNDIVQPLVILNAPPVHFDVFGDTIFDVSGMWDGDPGGFKATYRKESSSTTEIETKISRDWVQSNSIKFGFGKYGVGVDANMENRYGRGWSRVEGSSSIVKIGVKVDAIADDYIYATVSNYNLWEYPLYADDNLIGHLLVVDPQSKSIQHSWFPSKDWSANSYIPNHEVGNVLSYQQFSNLQENPDLDELLRTSETFALGGNSSYQYYLDYEYFQSTSSDSTNSLNTSYALSGNMIALSLGGGEEYASDDITTHTTTVKSDLYISAELGSVNMGLGEVPYDVTAYTYWAKNGALVLDYAVSPDLSGPGSTPTWWQVHYNKQDPAFILPWRYDDPWKGLTLQDPAKRFQTKEITFYPFNAERGDTVLIVARVRNLGLVNTEVPICVSFYHGDPDNGGVLLVGTDGSTKVSTAALIPARSWSTVQFPWRVPPEIQQYPRIYAKINPDTVMDEIHTNNNKGFAVFPLSSLPLGVSDKQGSQSLPNKFSLSQNYPNPFNPTTTINFNLPKASNVTLKIFNILGEEVATLVSKRLPAGSHSYQWSRTGGIASGIYLYRLRAGNFVETKKMVLLR